MTFWAGKGYAAIAMDLAGCGPNIKGEYDKLFNTERLLRGGPGQDGKRKILDIDLLPSDQWPYHAVANVILAHSLIRSLPGIDSECTAVAGISWGGYLTSENLTYPPVSIAVFIECPTFNNQRRIKYYEGQESVLGFVQNI